MVTFETLISHKDKIGIVGLGYVGLPLAVHMSYYFDVIGYDKKTDRIEELKSGIDRTMEILPEILKNANIHYTDQEEDLKKCRFIIVAVPTPIDKHRNPDLYPLQSASDIVGRNMERGTCIVFESTVYPGVTEEVCLPILEEKSGMKLGQDFTIGYSPERINPGDKVHTLEKIIKVVSGSDHETAKLIQKVYGKVVKAGIHVASSIKVAEAAKVIENTQRDLNIALMNELAMIFHKIGIDTHEVLAASSTKWNFLNFTPGLVGGHCIGVDPYYLTFKAQFLGYRPEIILAGRRINDGMGKYIAEKTVKLLIKAGKQVQGAKIAVLGITFKENVPDLRNTKVIDIINELQDYGAKVLLHDPIADKNEARKYYGVELLNIEEINHVDAVILAVIHNYYRELGFSKIANMCMNDVKPIVIDVKAAFNFPDVDKNSITYWRL
ncbi:MAG: nucleotide sugar dehydrogenase [Desulfobacterales bacterium]|nr:nucleotide sugar dehydrogenase [Desulfobacterales bacterium]